MLCHAVQVTALYADGLAHIFVSDKRGDLKAGLSLTLLQTSRSTSVPFSKVSSGVVARVTTDAKGVASMPIPTLSGYEQFWAVIKVAGGKELIFAVQPATTGFSSADWKAELVLDRKLVKPGETLLVTGKGSRDCSGMCMEH
jgi:hypothetical protein